MRLKAAFVTASWVAALVCCAAHRAEALELKPKPFPLTVLGVHTEIPVSMSVDAKTEGDQLQAKVRAEGSLIGIQDNALAIARTIQMPDDNCARDGINPVVNDVTAASITPSGADAVIAISGHVTAWGCKHVLGKAIKSEIPPKKIEVTISAAVHLILPDATHVGLALSGPPSVSGKGLSGEAVSLLAGLFAGQISAQLQKALDASEARASFPSVAGLSVDVQTATFAARGNDLAVEAVGNATMTSAAFNLLLSRLNQ